MKHVLNVFLSWLLSVNHPYELLFIIHVNDVKQYLWFCIISLICKPTIIIREF